MRKEVQSIIRFYKLSKWSSILKWLLYIPATIAYILWLIVEVFSVKPELKVFAVWSVVAMVIGFLINIIFDFCLDFCKKRNLYFAEGCGKYDFSSARIADIIVTSYHIHEEIERIADDNAKLLWFETKRHEEVLKIYAELWIEATCREYNALIDKATVINEYGFVKEFLSRQLSLKSAFIKIFNWNNFWYKRLEKWFDSFECEYQKLIERKL